MQLESYTFDETKRGLSIYRTSLDETRRVTEEDPAIQAGRMSVETKTRLTQNEGLG